MQQRRAVIRIASVVAAIVVAVCALAACGSQSAPTSSSAAQAPLPPPVRASSSMPGTPAEIIVDGAKAEVDTVATDPSGALLPPQDVRRVGWWVDSGVPGGGKGTIVITGHINDVNQGDGYAHRFSNLRTGSTVTLETRAGTSLSYRVTSTTTINKIATDPAAAKRTDETFARLNKLDGPETLALVTCGGPFVGPPLGYQDNVVVFATPA